MTYDIALTEGRDGKVVVHRADCPGARLMADLGFPVATLFGCEQMPDELPLHDCLQGLHDQGDQSRPLATK